MQAVEVDIRVSLETRTLHRATRWLWLEVEVVRGRTMEATLEAVRPIQELRNPEEPIRRQRAEVAAPPVEVEQEELAPVEMEMVELHSMEAMERIMAAVEVEDTGVEVAAEAPCQAVAVEVHTTIQRTYPACPVTMSPRAPESSTWPGLETLPNIGNTQLQQVRIGITEVTGSS